MENGYALHAFSGTTLAEHPTEKLKQFLWRPRPPTLLPKDEQKRIRRNLREYSREFDDEDRYAVDIANTAIVEARKRVLNEWAAWVRRERDVLAEEREVLGIDERPADAPRAEAGKEAEGERVVEEIVEEIIEESEEVVQ